MRTLERLGATVREIELPHAPFAIPTYYLVATAEASSNLARYDGVRYGFRAPGATTAGEMYDRTRDRGFGAEVKRRIMLGTYVLSAGYYDAYYLKAQQVRTLIRQRLRACVRARRRRRAAHRRPTRRSGSASADDPLQMYLADVFTVSAPLAGLPAISVPCGFTTERLPVGLQLTGRAWDEATLLRVADAFERVNGLGTSTTAGLASENNVKFERVTAQKTGFPNGNPADEASMPASQVGLIRGQTAQPLTWICRGRVSSRRGSVTVSTPSR